MKTVWLLKDGELLPVQKGAKPMRTWMLADSLARRGHRVIWWSSTFSHQKKEVLFRADRRVEVSPQFFLQLINVGGYGRNVSAARLLHHRRLAGRFEKLADACERPDIIVTAYPPIGLAWAAVKWARERDIPVVVDVRDLWPDTFTAVSPCWLRPAVRVYARQQRRIGAAIFRSADAIVGMSAGCVRWASDLGARTDTERQRVFYIGFPPAAKADDGSGQEGSDGCTESHAGAVTAIYLGTFGHSYDLATVCAAATRLSCSGTRDVRFLLCGSGPKWQESARRSVGLDNVSLTGWVDAAKGSALLMGAGFALLPVSRTSPLAADGTLPNKACEYLAHGLPIVTSVGGELAELLTRSGAGITIPPEDPAAMADAAVFLARNPEVRARMADCATRLYMTRFNSESIYPQYADFIEQVISHSGAMLGKPNAV